MRTAYIIFLELIIALVANNIYATSSDGQQKTLDGDSTSSSEPPKTLDGDSTSSDGQQKTLDGDSICLNYYSTPPENDILKFKAKIAQIEELKGGIWLVIGENLSAPHAPRRFARENWIFLDPSKDIERCLKEHKRVGIRGFLEDLIRNADFLKGKIRYIADDCGIIANNYQCPGGGVVANSPLTPYEYLISLYDFLTDDGIIVTIPSILKSLTRTERNGIEERYDIKYSCKDKDFAIPYKC
ncbi:MAG: hypothetical protein LBT70_02515, partial [Holosporaceae bacterium]|nr:hypothetical protein [Holosporaceae bacterium]